MLRRPYRLAVSDPHGGVWQLSLDRTLVTPKGVVEDLGGSQEWYRREGLAFLQYGWRLALLAIWRKQRPSAWLLVARGPGGAEPRKKMWITPAGSRSEAIEDLKKLASHIGAGRSITTFSEDMGAARG